MGDQRIIPGPPFWRRPEGPVLEEAPEAVAIVLWQYVRHVRAWAEASPDHRRALFNPAPPKRVLAHRAAARGQVPELAHALEVLARLTAEPLSVNVHQLAEACQQVAQWAAERGHSETAIQFAEAAALVDTEKPRRANLAGRISRNAGDFPRAELWFERAIGLARRRGDNVERARGHIGYAILCQTLGRDRLARKHFNTAAVIAMQDGREWLAAEAQHDLMLMAAERGHYGEAKRHAAKALHWYPKYHQRFPFYVADLAFLLVCERRYRAASRLLRAFLRVVTDPPQQVLGVSVLVRALGGMGDADGFDRARRRLSRLLAKHRDHEAAARINLAEGERSAGMWAEAEENARTALALAAAQRDVIPERLARALLEDLAARRPAPEEEAQVDDAAFSVLLDAVATRLSTWAPTRRGRRPRSLDRDEWAAA